jgi:hypothetical protein
MYFIYFKEHDLYISLIPKIGTCSVRTLCLLYNNIQVNDNNLWSGKINKYIRNINNIEKIKKSKVLIFTRNPYHRLISGYLDKIIRNLKLPFCKTAIKVFKSNEDDKISFNNFIDFLFTYRHHSNSFDHHFRPQTHFYNKNKLGDNIKFIDINNNQDINNYFKNIKFNLEFPNITTYKKNIIDNNHKGIDTKRFNYYKENNICFGKSCDYYLFLTKYNIHKINEIYSNDFDTLNYEKKF